MPKRAPYYSVAPRLFVMRSQGSVVPAHDSCLMRRSGYLYSMPPPSSLLACSRFFRCSLSHPPSAPSRQLLGPSLHMYQERYSCAPWTVIECQIARATKRDVRAHRFRIDPCCLQKTVTCTPQYATDAWQDTYRHSRRSITQQHSCRSLQQICMAT